MMVHNFFHRHISPGKTPSVSAGIADHTWSIEGIMGLSEKREQAERGVAA